MKVKYIAVLPEIGKVSCRDLTARTLSDAIAEAGKLGAVKLAERVHREGQVAWYKDVLINLSRRWEALADTDVQPLLWRREEFVDYFTDYQPDWEKEGR